MIRTAAREDVPEMASIIDAAAQRYHGAIPEELWHEPYMSPDDVAREIADGIRFFVAIEDGRMAGVIGSQDKGDVTLVRHAYVRPELQRKGIGGQLLAHVRGLSSKPILIGTWAAATWAIDFYRCNGFAVVSEAQKNRLLRKYWAIPARQIETSVVLAEAGGNGNWTPGFP